MSGPLVLVALAAERAAVAGPLRAAAPGARLVRTGMGPARAQAATARAVAGGAPSRVVVLGTAGGCADGVRPGDLVVADALLDEEGTTTPLPGTAALLHAVAAAVAGTRSAGSRTAVHRGTAATAPAVATGAVRAALGAAGALAVDTESAAVARALGAGVPLAVVRAVVDTADAPLLSPATAVRGVRALRALRRAVPAVAAWLTTDQSLSARGK